MEQENGEPGSGPGAEQTADVIKKLELKYGDGAGKLPSAKEIIAIRDNANIYHKLLEIRRVAGRLTTEGYNKELKFKFVKSSQVLESVRDFMNDIAVILIPEVVGAVDPHSEKPRLLMRYTWINAIDPEKDRLVQMWYAQSEDDRDQGLGKALTYAEKFLVLKTFQIPTDKDDPDAGAPPKRDTPQSASPSPAQPRQPSGGSQRPQRPRGGGARRFDPDKEVSEKQLKMIRGKLSEKGYTPEAFNLTALKTAGDVDMALEFCQQIPAFKEYREFKSAYEETFGKDERLENFRVDFRNFLFTRKYWEDITATLNEAQGQNTAGEGNQL